MNRFDLEQSIMNCWSLIDDVEMVSEHIENLDLTKPEHIDILQNLLLGIHSIGQVRFLRLMNNFETMIEEKLI